MKRIVKSIAIFMLIVLGGCMCVACASNEVETKGTDIPIETNVVEELLESAVEENANNEIGAYVVPSESDFTWEEIDGGVALTGYTGTNTSIEVPAKLGNKDVIEIRGGSFPDGSVTGVKLPDTVKVIGEKGFLYCTSLVEIIFGKGTVLIETDAFDGCVSLKNVYLNDGLVEIGQRAFAANSSLEKIVIPETVEVIKSGAFVMSGLKELVIPGSVKKIEDQAFSRCLSLETVVLEDGVQALADEAFQSCKAMKSIEIPDSVTEMGWSVFVNCEDLVIKASAGSAAEAYAADFGHTFEAN